MHSNLDVVCNLSSKLRTMRELAMHCMVKWLEHASRLLQAALTQNHNLVEDFHESSSLTSIFITQSVLVLHSAWTWSNVVLFAARCMPSNSMCMLPMVLLSGCKLECL